MRIEKSSKKKNILPNGNGLHGDHSFYGIENPSKLTKKKQIQRILMADIGAQVLSNSGISMPVHFANPRDCNHHQIAMATREYLKL